MKICTTSSHQMILKWSTPKISLSWKSLGGPFSKDCICGWLMAIPWCFMLSGCRGWLLRCSNYFLYGDIGLFRQDAPIWDSHIYCQGWTRSHENNNGSLLRLCLAVRWKYMWEDLQNSTDNYVTKSVLLWLWHLSPRRIMSHCFYHLMTFHLSYLGQWHRHTALLIKR